MDLEITLRDACNGLKAVRAAERKKNADILKEFLTRNAVPSLLTVNTLQRKGYTWNNLFEDINEFILKETEKYETSKSFESVIRPLCISLLQLCIAGSNKGKAYIKCDNIIERCLFILNDKRLSEAVGDGYLNLLLKYILPCEHYLGYIAPNTWKNLLDVCLAACFSNRSKLDTYTKLRLILLILKIIKENSQFIKPVIDSLPLFERYFLMMASDKKVQDVITEIITILLEMLSADYRLTMCAFVETMLPSILKFYDQNKDQNKKRVLFKLLYYTVALHHPLGRHQNEEGSLAYNWEQWKKYLNSITELICLEVTYIQKGRRPNDKVLQNYSYFFELAATVYYQIFNLLDRNDNEDKSATKRLKLNLNNNKTFSDIINEMQQNLLPWIAIVHVYVKKYGISINACDYLSLLNCLQMVWSNNANLDWDIYQELTCLVLQNVNKLNDTGDEYDNALISLWNSCMRNCTATNASHGAIHTIIQSLLKADIVKDPQTQHLIKLYLDKDMPVTSHSVNTLSIILDHYYNKCIGDGFQIKCFSWLTAGDISNINPENITELLLRLIATESININTNLEVPSEFEILHEILFNSNEKFILFSEFEMNAPMTILKEEKQFIQIEVGTDVDNEVQEYFRNLFIEMIAKLRHKELDIIRAIKLINIVISYIDMTLKYRIKTRDEFVSMGLYTLLKTVLNSMYTALKVTLQADDINIPKKIIALQLVKELLISRYDELVTNVLRSSIDKELFYAINNIINTKIQSDDIEISISGDEDDMNFEALKHNCFFLLAAYCRKQNEYRDEILKVLLDESVYDFETDLKCILRLLEIMTDTELEDAPLGLAFKFMQCMCRKLYRSSKASFGIIKILVKIIHKLCSQDSIKKNNCFIMIRSYLQLSSNMYYPPKVASLVYECVAKLILLNRKQDDGIHSAFEDAFMNKIKGDIHSMRIYCCYLLRSVAEYCINDIETIASDLLEVFLVDVSNDANELMLKDESANRTLTVLHCFLALAQSKPSAIQSIILKVIHLQITKSLDKKLVAKVLNKIANNAGVTDLQAYLNVHILPVIYFWFTKNQTVKDLPINLFGYDDFDMFIERHKGWLIAGDILWRKAGRVSESDVLNYIANIQGQTIENVLETCFLNIVALVLPYIVSSKYNLEYYPFDRRNEFKIDLKNATKMFKDTCDILEQNKWNDLFLENIGQLLLLAASHMRDCEDTEEMFHVKLSQQRKDFCYPKRVFSAILDYFESLIDESVIKYLCKNQTITVFKVLFQLWKTVIQENIFESKVLALHAYVTFLKNIPLDLPSDTFICNYACSSFTEAIKHSSVRNEIKVFIKGLRIVLDNFLPHKSSLMHKSLLELLPVLIIKNEGGFDQECASFLHYLLNDIKVRVREYEDVVDFINSMSQGVQDIDQCVNLSVFQDKLRIYKISLARPSHETLVNLKEFLIRNKDNIQNLYRELDSKKFSEDCATSVIHLIIHSLCNIIKSACDEKTVVEACNCLSEISSFDLKTLVTVPPANTDNVTNVDPKHYFAQVAVKALLEVFFDEDPNVTNEVADTLMNLLSCVDINSITDLEDVDKQILKPLLPETTKPNDTYVDGAKLEAYYTMFPDGIFLNALLNKNKDDWLKEVTCTLLEFVNSETNYVNNLREVCISKSQVCYKILPALIGLLVQCLSERHIQAVGEHINKLFIYIYEQTFDNNSSQNSADYNFTRSVSTLPDGYKTIVQHMLDIVDFIRVQRNYYGMRPGCAKKTLNFLDLEYDKVAWAASVVDQNWAAIYYGELWAMFENNGLVPSSPESTTNLSNGENLQRIFRKCYVAIGEIDAVEGCGSAHLTIESEKRKHLINTEQYSDALLLHDIALSCGTQPDQELQYGVVRSLHKSGMHHLALRYIKSLPENEQLNDVKYECLTFLGDWSHFVDTKELGEMSKQKNCNRNSIVKAFQYACLKNCLHIQTAPGFEDKLRTPLNEAKLAVSRLCHNLNMENCQNIYKILEKLHMFRDIEDYFAVRSNRSHLFELIQSWSVENLPPFQDFKHIESLSSQRVLILEHAVKCHDSLLNDIVSLQIKYAKLALNNNRVQMAQRLLSTAKKTLVNEDISLVESEISWAKGHKELALSLLRNIVNKQSLDVKLAAVSLRRYALWMADSKRENPRDIINKYLKKSLNTLRQEDVDIILKVYRDIAKFADTEYKQVVAYMNSSTFENRVKCVENMKGLETDLNKRPMKSLSKEEGRALSTNRRFKELDEAEIANTRAERENFLQLAMRYYMLSLKQCNESNLSVFRVISLWLDNHNFEFPEDVNDTFEGLLHAIPSWKFVTILPQLAPRLTNEDTAFMYNLKKLLKRCAAEHPHHALPILFLLKNSDKDSVILNASSRYGSSSGNLPRDQATRVLAAAEIVDDLRLQNNKDLTLIIDQMEKMCDAIISFANHVPPSKTKKQKIPDAENIHKLRKLSHVPVLTVTLPIKQDCNYAYINTFHGFANYYELVGGVNCPKKILCKDSSGKNHILLIKGGDDLKQDAVMQQVFNIVNTLLENDPVTNKNKLLIRTYKVVPLSRLSGVLEWCEGTLPLGAYLVGTDNSGAHARYRPQDMSCDAARRKMVDCCNDSNEDKLAVYTRIVKEFKPVFHYFFTEHYLDPVTWYERRLAYTKSVATSSMVGYILGLGDRHLYNILIDERTAEVIHIDLGIAFDQGKTLRTPETIPFRLTRDIIAGFGCSGTEGIFRRCCEKTMQLLRDNQETLLTILEVLLCDPLYSWSVRTAQQNAPATNRNSTLCTSGTPSGLAKRALLVVTSKLSGTEEGVAGGVAVAGQVARLLHIATDPFNLCRLFHGWQPYL